VKARTAITVALVLVTAVGLGGATRNTVRRTADRDAATSTGAAAREISRTAASEETTLGSEIDLLRLTLADLQQQVFGDDEDVVETSAALRQSAEQLGLTVSRLDVDPTRGVVSATITGPDAATLDWLQTVEQTMIHDSVLLQKLVVTAMPENEMTVAIEMRQLRPGEGPPSPGGPSRTELLEAAASWPTPGSHRLTAAFLARPTGALPADGKTTPDSPAPVPSPANGRVELLGTASVNGITQFVLRFGDEKSIRALEMGQHAYGWSLIHANEQGLVLQKEGEHFAIPR